MVDRDGPSEDVVREELRHEREEVGNAGPSAARRGTGGSSDDDVARVEAARAAEARMAAESGGPADRGDEPQDDESAGNGTGAPGVTAGAAAADAAAEAEVAAEGEDEDELTVAQRERDRYLDLARRTQADFDNYRKRAAKDSAAAGARAKTGLVRELLPVVDNLERALSSATGSDTAIAEGVRLVHADLVGVLERNGIISSEPSGERFDPTEHEAISMRPEEGTESGIVLDVVEKGYKLNDTVIRPARVVVSS